MRRIPIVILIATILGCSEPVSIEDPAQTSLNGPESHLTLPAKDIPPVVVDLSMHPELMARTDEELVSLARNTEGKVLIAIKEPGMERLGASGLRSGMSEGGMRAAYRALLIEGVRIEEALENLGIVVALVDPVSIPRLLRNPHVDYIDPVTTGSIDGVRMPANRELESVVRVPSNINTAEYLTWGTQLVRAQLMWGSPWYATGFGAKVLIIDTGFQNGHPDIPTIPGFHCGGPFGGCTDTGPRFHGTHIVGKMVARDNTFGIIGVSPGITSSSIFSYAACDPDSGDCDSDEITIAINWVIGKGVGVVNMSFSVPQSTAVANAIAQGQFADILFVTSAGNRWPWQQNGTTFPATVSGVIGVSGVKPNESFANDSPCLDPFVEGSLSSRYGVHVDVAAAFWSLSTTAGSGYGDHDDGWCGTSMSSPYVAAVAANIRAEFPALTATQVADILMSTAKDKGPSGRDDEYGWGIVDAYAAMTEAAGTSGGGGGGGGDDDPTLESADRQREILWVDRLVSEVRGGHE